MPSISTSFHTSISNVPVYTEARLNELREIFLLHDLCGDGKIAASQVADCARVFGANPSEAAVQQFVWPLRATERIGFEEFLRIYEHICQSCCPQLDAVQCKATLRLLDEDDDGRLPAELLRRLLTKPSGGEQLSQADVDEILAGHVDEQGNVNYTNLVQEIMDN